MLKSIYVKDFILFDRVELDFSTGMSAFTGETGAGKSLLIDAISMLLGARIRGDMVKQGCETSFIEGVFELDDHSPLHDICKDAGFELEENLLIISREFSVQGKGIARINHRQTTLSLIKEIAPLLVDIHSQHDTQYLLNSRYHLHLLDQYVDEKECLQKTQIAFKEYDQVKKTLEEALLADYNEDDLEFLNYQLQEIEDAGLDEEEQDALEGELRHLQSFEKISKHLNQAIAYIDGNDSAKDQLYEGCRELDELQDFDEIKAIGEHLYEYYYGIEEQMQKLHDILDVQEYDERRVNEIQERLFAINKIKRKYGGTFTSVKMKQEELVQRIDQIENRQEFLDRQQRLVEEKRSIFLKHAQLLSKMRKEKGELLKREIECELHDLQLEHARFDIRFKECECKDGIDSVEFMVSMNSGEPLRPLVQSASGGELSRLMLGLKTIFSKLQGIETVIFDEIDTGVSGRVASAIGMKMHKLAADAQVFCVTHLAQVAACGDQQYLVEKQQLSDHSLTNIKKLELEERLNQLAFIATGSTSSSSLEAAKELYQRSQSMIKTQEG